MTAHNWRDIPNAWRGRSDGWVAIPDDRTAHRWHLQVLLFGASYPVTTTADAAGLMSYTLDSHGTTIHAAGFLTLDDALDDAIAAIERQSSEVRS